MMNVNLDLYTHYSTGTWLEVYAYRYGRNTRFTGILRNINYDIYDLGIPGESDYIACCLECLHGYEIFFASEILNVRCI